jgi:hypothetical protein
MKPILFHLVFILLLAGTGMSLHALILSDMAVIEAKVLFISDTYIPDESDVSEVLKVPYIAEIEITGIIEGDTTFGCGIIKRLTGSRVRINGISYMNPLLEEALREGDEIVCYITYFSKEYHQYGYRTSINITVFNIIEKVDSVEEKKQYILKILQKDEYQYKEDVLKHVIHPENIYITEWKVSDFVKGLEKQKSYCDEKIKQSQNTDNVSRMFYNQCEKIKRFMEIVSNLDTDAIIYEVRLPGLRRNYDLLIDIKQEKVLEANRLSFPV